MKLSELLENRPHTTKQGSEDIEITNIVTDSRQATVGSLFVAMTGLGADGHHYIQNAIENGASSILAERMVEVGTTATYVLVENTPMELSYIAQNFYGHPAKKMHMIGITGTNGKTTSTQLIKQILDHCGYKTGLIGTNRHMIGSQVLPSYNTTPEAHDLQRLFAAMASENVSYVIMEVSSHALELHRLAGVHFDVAAFSNLTQDHLDFHGTMENYRNAKAKFFSMSDIGVINIDDAAGMYMKEAAGGRVLTFGVEKEADFRAERIELGMQYAAYTMQSPMGEYAMKVNIPGRFSVYNSLTAVAVCAALGVPMEQIQEGLMVASGVVGRAEVILQELPFTVLIDYAHTPDGLENILSTVRGFAKEKIITVFGCGGNRDKTKRPKMGACVGAMSDVAVVTSDNPRMEEPQAIVDDILVGMKDAKAEVVVKVDRREAIQYALSVAKAGDVVVLAGKGHETYQDIGGSKIDFDERIVVREEARMLGLL